MSDPHQAHQADPLSVAVELERLRGTMEAGFARVDGSLALLVQRSDRRTARSPTTSRGWTRLSGRAGRWPLASMTTLAAVSAVAVTAWQITTQ